MDCRLRPWVVLVAVIILAGGLLALSSAQQGVGSIPAPDGANRSLEAPSQFASPQAKLDGPVAVAPPELTTTITLLPADNCTPISSTSPPINTFPVTYEANGTQQEANAGNATISLATDAGTTVTIAGIANTLVDVDEEWVLNSAGTPVNVTSGTTVTLYYYEVLSEVAYYSVVGGGSIPTPVLTYVTPPVNASSVEQTPLNSSTLSTTPESFQVVWGSTASVNGTISGNSTERWATIQSLFGPFTDQYDFVQPIEYYHQFNVTIQYSVSGGTGYSAPVVSCLSFGGLVNVTAGASMWVDAKFGFCEYPTVLPGSTSVMQWESQGLPTSVQGPGSIIQDYQLQYLLNITGGGLTSIWYNSNPGSLILTVPDVFNRTAGIGERVTSYSIDGGTPIGVLPTASNITMVVSMQTAHNLTISSIEQYEVGLDSKATAALASITPPTIPGDNYWYDAGTNVTVVFHGAWGRANGTGYRLESYTLNRGPTTPANTTGPVTVLSIPSIYSPESLTATTVDQYYVTVSAGSLVGITSPPVTGDTGWYDSGTIVNATFDYSWGAVGNQSRLNAIGYNLTGLPEVSLSRSGSGTFTFPLAVSGPVTISVDYTTQYYLAITGVTMTGTSVPSPTGDDYFDAGSTLRVTTPGTWGLVNGTTRQGLISFSIDGQPTNVSQVSSGNFVTPTIVMNSAHQVSFSSGTQYLVTFGFTDSTGAVTFTPQSTELTLNGAEEVITGSRSWFDSGTSINVTRVVWDGTGLTPTGTANVLVTGPETLEVPTSIFEASLKVTDLLGFPVTGADVSVSLPNGTAVTAVTAEDGVARLGLIPAGMYRASVSGFGLTTMVSVDPAAQAQAEASIPLSYSVLGILFFVVAAPTVAYFIGFHRGRRSRRATLPTSSDYISDDMYEREKVQEEAVVKFRDVGCKISGKTILHDITLDVERGEIIGILGRNGAGKTTLLSLISGLRSPSSGEVVVLGERMPGHGAEYRRKMGFVLQEDALYQESTVLENLKFSADLYDVRDPKKRIDEVLELLGLTNRRNQVVSTLSGGLRRRTAIARAFLHDPDLFIVDEPTLGVDADARHAVWAYLRLLRSRKRTVIVATNYLDEALALCDRVAVLAEGTMLAVEEPRELVRRTGSCIDIDCNESVAVDIASGATDLKQVIRSEVTLSGISLFLDKGADPDEVLRRFASYGRIEGFRLRAPDLSEVFKSLGR